MERMKILNKPADNEVEKTGTAYDVSRRRFFQLAGGIAGAGLLLSACHKRSGPTDVYIGSGDTALLNYLYILEQVEAAFYTQAVTTNYYGITASELQLLTDVRDQEIGHREFLQTLLGANAIPAINIAFKGVTFADRTSFLTNATQLEDLVISGINGAASLFSDTDYVVSLSKMVTVEARHSAYFRDLNNYNSFADSTVISSNGLDQSNAPSSVLGIAESNYILTRFDSSKLPN
jgi:hypothetical protein